MCLFFEFFLCLKPVHFFMLNLVERKKAKKKKERKKKKQTNKEKEKEAVY